MSQNFKNTLFLSYMAKQITQLSRNKNRDTATSRLRKGNCNGHALVISTVIPRRRHEVQERTEGNMVNMCALGHVPFCDPMDCSPPDSSVHGDSPGKNISPPGDLPNPGTEPRSPALQADSLLSEPRGKFKNTGVSNPFLLQGIFLTQESNWGLLHCRQILYQLTYQGKCINKPK